MFLMKKSFLASLIIMSWSVLANADVIVLNDGSTLQVYNVEPANKWVYYTETDDSEAAVKRVAVEKVFAYKIGEEPLVSLSNNAGHNDSSAATSSEQSSDSRLEAVPAANNAAIIAAYNNHPELRHNSKKPNPGKHPNKFLSLWGIEDGSVLSDANVEIAFENVYADILKKSRIIGTRIKVINKTNAPIYIDLASCFKIGNGGYATPYFTNSTYSEGLSSATGASLNLGAVAGALGIGGSLGTLAGGVSVGKTNGHSTSITRGEQQIIVVPAGSSVYLPGDKVSNGVNIVECYEPFLFNNSSNETISIGMNRDAMEKLESLNLTILQDEKTQSVKDNQELSSTSLDIGLWNQTSFTPENTPKKIGRIITYSTSPDFSTYTSLPVSIFMRGAFGLKVMFVGDDLFTVPSYDVITDKAHFIVGPGFIKK